MSSYKEANERLNRTGNGITDPLKYSTFQEYIVNNVCKHYYILDPVFKDRPNVRPWATNEDIDIDIEDTSNKEYDPLQSTEFLTSDDESNESSVQSTPRNKDVLDSDVEIIDNPKIKRHQYHSPTVSRSSSHNSSINEYDNMSSSSKSSVYTHNTSNISNITDDTNLLPKARKVVSKKEPRKAKAVTPTRKKTTKTKKKYTPSQAKNMEKDMKKKTKASIASKQSNSKYMSITTIDQEDRDFLIESRDSTIRFETLKHNDMKELEERKIRIENERLLMERDTMKLRHEQMLVQNSLERSKLALLKLEIFKARQEIKKLNPDVTDDYLNNHFPFPE